MDGVFLQQPGYTWSAEQPPSLSHRCRWRGGQSTGGAAAAAGYSLCTKQGSVRGTVSPLGVLQQFVQKVMQAGPAMVATWTKTVAKRKVATQTKVSGKHAGIQVSDCKGCQSQVLLMEDGRGSICVQCH